jgi:DNA modification methylase
MKEIPDGSVDMVMCDLPYGTTQNKWDSVIPFAPLWSHYWRVCKPNAAVVLTAQCPFDKMLGASQIQHLKYEWIWQKTVATGHLNSKKQPLKEHENILVFYRKPCTYLPQMVEGARPSNKSSAKESTSSSGNYGVFQDYQRGGNLLRFPRSVQKLNSAYHEGNAGLHPTQKPVALMEYLIKTYTNPGDVVLDNCMGSGTTGVACKNTGRNFIGIERDPVYYAVACRRMGVMP